MVTKTLLIEIGTEELPPKALNKLRLALQINVETEIDQVELSYRKVESFASPRRLAVLVHDLKDQQPTQGIEKKGPSEASAFDNGEPTKALKGFMKGCNVNDPSQLDLVETEKGNYIVYRTNEPGLYLESLLEELLKNALAALPIAKRMRWGKTRAEFVRPVQWLVCLYGDTIIPINLFGKKSGNTSRGHRFMSDGNFQIKNAGDYSGQCRENFVLANFEERKEKIRDQIQAIANKENLYLGLDEELLDEVTSLVEWPKAIIGDFDKEFLKVPSKVLISAMKEHQRYFHLVDSDDRLVSKFITISNIESRDYSEVIKGNERVIKARLSDAAFFFDQDTRTRLDEKSNKLDSVIFQAELGNYAEKSDRISALSAYIAARVEEDVEAAIRAGRLCKADLVTDMVSEFSDLQGIMGGYYARHDGENEEVCVAIEEHYRPTQSGGELPSTRLGSCLAIADKVDSLVGIFGIKQAPTGSKDPFALRRQSLGVIRVCIEHGLDFSLDDFLVESSRLYGKHFKVDEVCTYIVERMSSYYREEGVASDIVDAVLNNSGTSINLVEIDSVIRALQIFRDGSDSEKVISMNKRIAKLLNKNLVINSPFDEALITNSAEKELSESLKKLGLDKCKGAKEKLERLASLQPPVDKFFEDVMVMTNDEATRNNRISLLQKIRGQFLQLADFSLLQ